MLADIAGLVPGDYWGREKRNKRLDDLTDGDMLIHVVDASWTVDFESNIVGNNDRDDKDDYYGNHIKCNNQRVRGQLEGKETLVISKDNMIENINNLISSLRAQL